MRVFSITASSGWPRWIKSGQQLFLFDGGYQDRHIPKEAGFYWHPEKRVWWTDDLMKAANLADYADDSCEQILSEARKKHTVSQSLSRATATAMTFPKPDGLDYYPFQKAGIQYAEMRENTLIGDEMGLGKTIQAVGLINSDDSINKVLVVCPNSLKLNWLRELQKWLVRPLRVAIADSSLVPLPEDGFDVTIINWDIIAKKSGLLQRQDWDLLVADEVHKAKNPKAQRSQALYAIPAKRRVGLTGTPILNRPEELFPLIEWLDPGRWKGKRWYYLKRYCNAYRSRFGWDTSGANVERLPELQDILRKTIMIRRLKSEVLTELPAKVRQVVELEADANTMEIVRREREVFDARKPLMEAAQVKVQLAKAEEDDAAYAAAVRELRSVMGVAFEEMARLRKEVAIAKVPYVVSHIEDALEAVGKVVLFCHHKEGVAYEFAKHFGDQAVLLTGDQKPDERQDAVDRFQQDDSCRLFIGTIGAAGVGLTLTASSHVVFAELDWVPGNVSQAEDRCHRIGQKDCVQVQHIVLNDSVDAKMARTIVEKQAVIDAALNRQEEPVPEEPGVPGADKQDRPATVSTSRQKIAREAETITLQQIEAVQAALQLLDAMCDGARRVDRAGFNKVDSGIGKSLARQGQLTKKQAALGKKIAWKYRRQLSADLVERMKG